MKTPCRITRFMTCLGAAACLASIAVVDLAVAQSPVPWPRASQTLVGAWAGEAVQPEEALIALSRDDGFTSPTEKVRQLADTLNVALNLKADKTGEVALTLAGAPRTPYKILWSVKAVSGSNEEFDLVLTTAKVDADGGEVQRRTLRFSPYDNDTFVATELGGDFRMPPFRYTRVK